MDVQKQYSQVVMLKHKLENTESLKYFLSIHQEALLAVFEDASLFNKKPTRQALFTLLDTEQSRLSISIQSAGTLMGLRAGKIAPLTSVLEHKRKEELAGKKDFVSVIQLACSIPEQYFCKNTKSKLSDTSLIDYVVIDPNKVPQGFLDVFQIESVDLDGKNIKELFKQAKPLQYHEKKHTYTWRVVFINSKLVVFRELQQLLHKEKKLTQGEKKLVDYKTYFNAYEDVYSATRAQMYIIDKENDKIENYKDVQKQMIALIQDIAFETKHLDEKRKLDQIIEDIGQATSFSMMASKFYNLYKIQFANKTIVANHLHGAGNKVSQELNKLSSIVMKIKLQTTALENLIYRQEYLFNLFSAQVSQAIIDYDSRTLFTVFQNFYQQLSKDQQKTEPFITLEHQIKALFGFTLDQRYMQTNKSLLKAEILINLQKIYLQVYQLEHKIKLGVATHSDFAFDVGMPKGYMDVFASFFGKIDEYLNVLRSFGGKVLSSEDSNVCLALLQKLKQLPDWDDNMDVLQKF